MIEEVDGIVIGKLSVEVGDEHGPWPFGVVAHDTLIMVIQLAVVFVDVVYQTFCTQNLGYHNELVIAVAT